MRAFTLGEKAELAIQFAAQYSKIKQFPYHTQDEIRAFQFHRIKNLIDIAYYHTAFYREKYSREGIHPNDVRTWEDFARLPTVTKDELIERGPDLVDSRLASKDLIVSRSSGSSGKFVDIYLAPRALILQAIHVIRMLKELDPSYGPLDHEMLVYTSPYPFSNIGGLYRTFFVNNLLQDSQILAAIRRVRPKVLAIYPSILSSVIALCSGDCRDLGVRLIVTNSEQSTQLERDYYASAFGCNVYDEYSSEELGAIAYQCPAHQYHLVQDSTYTEVLDTAVDHAVGMESQGEIVGTNLLNAALPLIRYRQSDLGVLGTVSCKCGKDGPVLRSVDGRVNSSFRRSDGTVVPSGRILDWTYSLVIKLELGVREFLVIQKDTTHIEIQLVATNSYRSSRDNPILTSSFKAAFGDEFDIEVVVVTSIPKTTSGKRNPIRSMVY